MKICIEDNADGTYTVSDESQEELSEPGETEPNSGYSKMQGATMKFGDTQAAPMQQTQKQSQQQSTNQPTGQTANSLEEALRLVVQMFRSQSGGIKQNPFERGMKDGMMGG